jgi:hypothetical protein
MGTSVMAREQGMRSPTRRSSGHSGGRTSVSPARVVGETVLVTIGALAYFLVRGLMDSQESAASANASALIDLERHFGVYHEGTL